MPRIAETQRLPKEKEQQIICLYQAGESMNPIADGLGISTTTVYRVLCRNGVSIRPKRKDFFDEAFFSGEIATEAQAWLLGFIAADGYLSEKYQTLTISLQLRDKGLLEKILALLKSSSSVGEYLNAPVGPNHKRPAVCKIRLRSSQMTADLKRHGVHQAKTFTVQPWSGPQHLMRHWWRGVVDGDGGWVKRPTTWGLSKGESLRLTGNLEMVQAFAAFVLQETGVRASDPKSVRNSFWVGFTGIDKVKAVARLLWDGATVFLDRKKATADWAMSREPRQQRRDYTAAQLDELYADLGTWKKVAAHLKMRDCNLHKVRKRVGLC